MDNVHVCICEVWVSAFSASAKPDSAIQHYTALYSTIQPVQCCTVLYSRSGFADVLTTTGQVSVYCQVLHISPPPNCDLTVPVSSGHHLEITSTYVWHR